MSECLTFRSVDGENIPAVVESERREHWLVLRVFIGNDCPLTAIKDAIETVSLQQLDGKCKADVVTRDAGMSAIRTERSMGDDCLGWIFHEYRHIPRVIESDADSITISIFHDNESLVSDLVSAIRSAGYAVDVKRLVSVNQDMRVTSTVLCDLSVLTEKQREAVQLAKERGYYDRCGSAPLERMAEAFDISKSALSRRLKSAEAKLVNELVRRS